MRDAKQQHSKRKKNKRVYTSKQLQHDQGRLMTQILQRPRLLVEEDGQLQRNSF